jgi:hypothetical protein
VLSCSWVKRESLLLAQVIAAWAGRRYEMQINLEFLFIWGFSRTTADPFRAGERSLV